MGSAVGVFQGEFPPTECFGIEVSGWCDVPRTPRGTRLDLSLKDKGLAYLLVPSDTPIKKRREVEEITPVKIIRTKK